MNLLYMLKILTNISFYFLFANFIAAFFGAASAVPALPVFALSAFLSASLRDKNILRYLPLALLAFCFLILPRNTATVLLLIPPQLYMVYAAINIQSFLGRRDFEELFRFWLKILLPLVILMLLFARSYFEAASLPFGFVLLGSAVLCMRMVRHDPKVMEESRFKLLNLISVLGVYLLAALLSSRQFLSLAGTLLFAVHQHVVIPVIGLFARIVFAILYPILSFFLGGAFEGFPQETEPMENGGPLGEAVFGELEGGLLSAAAAEMIRAALILAALALAVFLIIRAYRRLLVHQINRRFDMEALPEGYRKERGKAPASRGRGPARRLRASYRRFLQLCQRHGITRKPHMTSADYTRRAAKEFGMPEEAAALRALYIPARYGEKTPERAAVKQAEALYRSFKRRASQWGR